MSTKYRYWKQLTRVMAAFSHTLAILMSKLRVSLEYAWSMARVWLKPRIVIFLLLFLIVGSGSAWGQSPVEITTDTNGNGTIEESEKKFYLIQTNAFPSFYIAPQDNNTITTNNILGEYMLWYFLDAGEEGGTQYYYIVNNSTEKCIYNVGGESKDNRKVIIDNLSSLSDENKEKCKFKLVVNNNGGTTGFYNINVKGRTDFYGLNKQGASETNANPIRLTNTQYINDTNSKWKFIPFNGTFTYPDPPFTPSTDSDKHYYEIHNIQKDTHYAATDATAEMVIFTNQANESRAWYFKEAASDTWYKYYYIINPATGGKYMYYNGTADNTVNQTKAIDVKAYDLENEDRYQFVVVQAARGDGATRVTCYAIIPKLLIDNLWTSSSIGYAQGSITNGLNMGIINSRSASNGAHWEFKTTTYTTVCDHPVIAFDRTTGKASITTATLLPSIYYTTDGTTPSSTNGTLYNEAFTLTEPTTVKAIVTKAGYTDSEVTTLTIGKVSTPTIQQETGTHNISITTKTPGATIYYTIDGKTPTTSSTLYTGASEELGGKHIKAIAVKDNMINSDIGEGEIDIRCATPAISFDNITSMVTLTCGTEGSTIHYTTDNSEPTPTSTAYSAPFSVTSPTTVKAIATHATLDPSVVAELVIPQVATPTIQNNGSNAVSITTETVGATIYYTTDGSTPTTSSTKYTVPLTENISNVTIKAIAVKEGMITSVVGSDAVILQCAAPDIKRSGNDGFTISCSFPASGVTIYYTTDGTNPTTSSSSISSGDIVPCTLPITVKAMAVATNYDYSDVATANLKEGMDGDGSVDNPYTIKFQPDVADFIEHANTPEGASLYYKVIATEPLDFSGAGPITQAFSGTFDGGTQPLTGLTHPLFNTVDGGVVKNVTLKNVAISSSADYVGGIAGIAQGYSRIYNCGILPNDATFPEGTHPTVTTTGSCAGGIVGKLDGDSRVINCYSYADVSASTYAAGIVGQNTFASTAEVSGGKYTKLKTAVVNCMFYGNITGGSNQYGVYGGNLITNAANTGISSYNYYRSGSTFTTGEPTAYNCSFPADERYLTQVEFHRSLLNSNRELCGWWVGSDVAPSTLTTTEVQAIPKDASLMYKWVVDPNLAPYPILKPFGKYPSIINTNTGTPWFDRSTANEFEGKQLGTLSVIIKSGGSAPDQHLFIPITDMDSLHYDFGYRKIQLPYYNTVFGNPNGANWEEKYAGNYTDQVVTGWKITNVIGGTQGSFTADWQYGYNFADRKCTEKDLYSKSGRVFAQGGYYYVPDGVTEITIEAYWGKAIYVRNKDGYYDRVNITVGNTGAAFAPAGTRDNNVNGATIQTTSIKDALTAANIDAKKTVYDYALVLVGNVQESVGQKDVTHATEATRGFTIMSVDFDFDEEPDYCLEWQLGFQTKRQVIAPIRFDFLPVVELGIAGKLHNSKYFLSLGCFRSKGHFEVTETAFIRFGQFEFELKERDEGPIILNGGIYDQYCRGKNDETNQHINYVILGGHIVMPSFTPGAHVSSGAKYQTRHCAVNVLGGDFTSFYLTGGYNEGITPFVDNPHCYIDGGRFGTIAAAYKEGIAGDVTWRINRALIGEFYGGGVMAQKDGTTYKIVKGSIDVVIDNSIVGKYCGGPKFGDMVSGKTVTTSASNTVFNQFFGAGNGGTNYMQYANTDATGAPVSDWSGTINSNYTPGKYRNKDQGYHADYDIEVINPSTGDYTDGRVVNRSYYYSAQFATTNTGNVTSTLNNCTINTNFYGGGFLGGVTGDVTSTLKNCTVKGAVFGAGYSASAGTVNIHNKDKVPPVPNLYTGMIKPQSGGTFTTYEWTNNKTFGTKTLSTGSPTILNPNNDGKNYIYTEVSLDNLGSVTGKVTLTIDGTTTVSQSVYGGGEESTVNGDTEVNVKGGTIGTTGKGGATWGNVYGGGKGKENDVTAGLVKGNTNINISGSPSILHNIYGGGAYGSVGTFTYDGTTGMPTALATENTGACTVTIKGGTIGSNGNENGMVFGSSRGDVAAPGTDGVDPNDRMAWVYSTQVTIGDTGVETTPTIRGSVYGSGENGHTFQNTIIDIQKGTIGIATGETIGDYSGAAYPYRGNVFGGGCGTDMYDSDNDGNKDSYNPLAGIVRGTTTVNITGGQVVHNVYGAGAMGSVGNASDATSGKTTINISGGRIGYDGNGNGHVFGAARGELGVSTAASGLANVRESEVNINYTTTPAADNEGKTEQLIAGSVFGGGEAGTVKESVAVKMTGGLVLNDVYGGGALADTQTSNWDATANENAGGWATGKTSASTTTTVHLTGGNILGEAYGGGLGETGKPAYVYGDVLLDLNGTTTSGETGTSLAADARGCAVHEVFGCNNAAGTPKGTVTVHVYATQNKNTSQIANTDGATPVTDAKVLGSYDVKAVYGGGNLAAYEPAGGKTTTNSTNVIIDGCGLTSIQQVYGGGNAASTPATRITVNGSFEIEELFGGGNGKDDLPNGDPNPGANVGFYTYADDAANAQTPADRATNYGYGSGKASVNVFGGTIHRVFGGSNTKGNVRQTAVTLLDEGDACEFCVDEAYGGGKSAPMDAEAKLLMACIPGLKEAYGGAENADIYGKVELNITNGTFDRVFGGNNLSGTINGSITVNIEEIGCRPVIIGELYGGGNLAGYSVNGYNDDGTPKETGTKLYDDPQVNVKSFTSIGKIFGGGFGVGATMVGNPTVNVNEVYGKYYNDNESIITADSTTQEGYPIPSHKKGKMGAIHTVFGGGNEAKVIGNTTVNIATQAEVYIVKEVTADAALPEGCYTRSGAGTTDDPFVYTAATGTASADVTYYEKKPVLGADIRENVYGGGNNAEVTGDAKVQIGKKKVE